MVFGIKLLIKLNLLNITYIIIYFGDTRYSPLSPSDQRTTISGATLWRELVTQRLLQDFIMLWRSKNMHYSSSQTENVPNVVEKGIPPFTNSSSDVNMRRVRVCCAGVRDSMMYSPPGP